MTLPLDRIEAYTLLYDLPFIDCPLDLSERFDDIIGVTYYENRKLEKFLFAISKQSVNYIRTKPIHASQTELPRDRQLELHSKYPKLAEYIFFTIDCIPNYELKTLFYSYGQMLVVLTPEWMRDEIRKEAKEQIDYYSD